MELEVIVNMFAQFYMCTSVKNVDMLLSRVHASIYDKVRIWFLPVIIYACIKVKHNKTIDFIETFNLIYPSINATHNETLNFYLCALKYNNNEVINYLNSNYHIIKLTDFDFTVILRELRDNKNALFKLMDSMKSFIAQLKLNSILHNINLNYFVEFCDRYINPQEYSDASEFTIPETFMELDFETRLKICKKISSLIKYRHSGLHYDNVTGFYSESIIQFELNQYYDNSNNIEIIEHLSGLSLQIFNLIVSLYIKSKKQCKFLDDKIKSTYNMGMRCLKLKPPLNNSFRCEKYDNVNCNEFSNDGVFFPIIWSCFNNLNVRFDLFIHLLDYSKILFDTSSVELNFFDMAFLFTIKTESTSIKFIDPFTTISPDALMNSMIAILNMSPTTLFMIPQSQVFDDLFLQYKSTLFVQHEFIMSVGSRFKNVYRLNNYSDAVFDFIKKDDRIVESIVNDDPILYEIVFHNTDRLNIKQKRNLLYIIFSVGCHINFHKCYFRYILNMLYTKNKIQFDNLILDCIKYNDNKHIRDTLMKVIFDYIRTKLKRLNKYCKVLNVLSHNNVPVHANLETNSYLISALSTFDPDWRAIGFNKYDNAEVYDRLLSRLITTSKCITDLNEPYCNFHEFIDNILIGIHKNEIILRTNQYFNLANRKDVHYPTELILFQHIMITNPDCKLLFLNKVYLPFWYLVDIICFTIDDTFDMSYYNFGLMSTLYHHFSNKIQHMTKEEFHMELQQFKNDTNIKQEDVFEFKNKIIDTMINFDIDLIKFLFLKLNTNINYDHMEIMNTSFHRNYNTWSNTSDLYLYFMIYLKFHYFKHKCNLISIKKNICSNIIFNSLPYDITYSMLDHVRFVDYFNLMTMIY